ncbi:MAG: hypothetical protein EOR63_32270 [Mesorhizobium sp.]|nr:MAG: hypothetical protein EOR63_32270 [Mesorhizobium sp.]
MIAWRYFVPRTGYFRSLAIGRSCPEIRWHVDRMALCAAGEMLVAAPMIIGYLALLPFIWMAEVSRGALSRLPDFSAKRLEILKQAHAILPISEIRSRIGLPPEARILTKADAEARKEADIHCAVNMADPANMGDA